MKEEKGRNKAKNWSGFRLKGGKGVKDEDERSQENAAGG
jgi:hypothetical protein